jgi:histidyl-tRNA synthetase
MPEIAAIRGFKDVLPDQSPYWRRLEDVARETARRHGLVELRPPIMERTALFSRGIGEDTDIVDKEMYTFDDRGGESVTLRPEATAGMVRAVIEHHLHEGGRPARLWCLGPMFRYERPQKGRLRQFHQLDVEILGDPGPLVDAEIIALLRSFLTGLGLKELEVVINSLGCPACRPGYREALLAWFGERRGELCPDCQRRLDRNPLRILDCKNPGCRAQTEGAPRLRSTLCPECQDHLGGVESALRALDVDHVIDDRLVRGLDYYTRTAFEVRSGALGSQNAVAGGGRYDGLVARLGGPDVPAIGFAAGLERLIMLMEAASAVREPGPDYYVAVLSPEAGPPALRLVQALRDRGLAVAADWEPGGLKSRLKRADKARAAKLIMMGPDELAAGAALVRDLATGEQKSLSLASPELF